MLRFRAQGIIIFNVPIWAICFSPQSLIKLLSSQEPKADFWKEKWPNAHVQSPLPGE